MYRARADYQHRPYKKRISRRDIFFSLSKIFIVISLIAYFSVWYTQQSYFHINKIEIGGTHAIDSNEIANVIKDSLNKKYLFFWGANNAALFPSNNVRNKIYSLSSKISFVDIDVSRRKVSVRIKEYDPRMRYCISLLSRKDSNVLIVESSSTMAEVTQNNEDSEGVIVPPVLKSEEGLKELASFSVESGENYNCYWADENGFIFSKSPSYSGIPILTIIESDTSKNEILNSNESVIGKNILEKKQYENLMTISDLLRRSGIHIREVQHFSNDDVTIDVGYPWFITLNLMKNPENTVDNLLLALKELNITSKATQGKINHIDLRFGNKVFYK